MTEILPRYEFRAFAQNFGMVETKMRRLAKCEQIRESAEIYIISAANSENNTKIRDRKMDIKVFVEKREGLEQWNPRMKGEFPMKAEVLRKEVFPAFGVAEPGFQREEYGLQEYLDEIIFPHPQLTAVNVFKLRFAFTVNGCITEIADLLINGAAIRTVAVEHTDIGAILKAKEMLGLAGIRECQLPSGDQTDHRPRTASRLTRVGTGLQGAGETVAVPRKGGKAMAKEIERKFLVKGEAWKALARGTSYRQGYLNSVKERTVRVRTIDDKGYLTVKGITTGATRSEFEYEIPAADADAMLTRPLREAADREEPLQGPGGGAYLGDRRVLRGEPGARGGRGGAGERGAGFRKTRLGRRGGDGRSPLFQLEPDQASVYKMVNGPE